jgi:pilus assembly protein Flp/PilA
MKIYACGEYLNEIFSLFFNPAATPSAIDCVVGILAGYVRLERSQECGMRRLIWKFVADQSGATAIEYAIIAGFLSIVIVVAVNGIGTTLNGKFASVNSSLK